MFLVFFSHGVVDKEYLLQTMKKKNSILQNSHYTGYLIQEAFKNETTYPQIKIYLCAIQN